MRQSNQESMREEISMEEYLSRRQEKRRAEVLKDPQKKSTVETTAMELARLYV